MSDDYNRARKQKIPGKYSIFELWHERDFFVERTHPIRKAKNPWKIQHFEKTQHFVERTHLIRKTKNPWKIQDFEKTQPLSNERILKKKNQKTLENTAFLSIWHERGFCCRTITTVLENPKSLENTAFLSFGTNATFLSNERILFEKPKILGKYSISRKRSTLSNERILKKTPQTLENTAFLSFGTNEVLLSDDYNRARKPKVPGKYSIFEFWHGRDFFQTSFQGGEWGGGAGVRGLLKFRVLEGKGGQATGGGGEGVGPEGPDPLPPPPPAPPG